MSDEEYQRLREKIEQTLQEGAAIIKAAEKLRSKNRPVLEFAQAELKKRLRSQGQKPDPLLFQNQGSVATSSSEPKEASEDIKRSQLSRIVARRGRV